MAKMSIKGMPMPMMKKKEEDEMEGMPEMEDMPEEETEVEVKVEGPAMDMAKISDDELVAEMKKRGLIDEGDVEAGMEV